LAQEVVDNVRISPLFPCSLFLVHMLVCYMVAPLSPTHKHCFAAIKATSEHYPRKELHLDIDQVRHSGVSLLAMLHKVWFTIKNTPAFRIGTRPIFTSLMVPLLMFLPIRLRAERLDFCAKCAKPPTLSRTPFSPPRS
jgi:hypothetical protein